MKKIGILILLLPVCVFADVGFHPKESNVFFSPETNNNLLDFNLLQISDTSYTVKKTATFSTHAKEWMGGAVGGALGALPGGLIALVGYESFGFQLLGGALCILGATIGLPKGVGFVGKKLGEDGDYWKTLLGMALGSVVGVLIGGYPMFIIDEKGSGVVATVVGVGIGSIFSIAGAVWGYNW